MLRKLSSYNMIDSAKKDYKEVKDTRELDDYKVTFELK